ncbi:hypothetical protein AB4Y45_33630 [Paraburkholderia sp. EG287A]|uniref:hypothetical protein n=1 Tax=Paraburkholderia sp. EG287A TaxID=3237012 RepID=UPI0034D1DF5D
MASRSMNYLVTKVGVALTPAVAAHLRGAHVVSDVRGSLFVWESNFAPMWSRDGKGESCTADLDDEVVIHRYLGTLNVMDFRMVRAGDETGTRGQWEDHGFASHDEVKAIEAEYTRLMSEGLV